MGTVFEELIRHFNEENNKKAGEHFTPRDVVKLMAKLLFLPVADRIESSTISWQVTRIANVFEERKVFNHAKEDLLSIDRYRGIVKQTEIGRKVRAPRDRNGYKLIEPGQLGYNILNAFMGSIGVSKYRGIVSPAYAVAQLRDEQEPWYFHYLLRTPLYQRQFNRFSYGIMYERNRLYYDRFKIIPIPVPLSPTKKKSSLAWIVSLAR